MFRVCRYLPLKMLLLLLLLQLLLLLLLDCSFRNNCYFCFSQLELLVMLLMMMMPKLL